MAILLDHAAILSDFKRLEKVMLRLAKGLVKVIQLVNGRARIELRSAEVQGS
jgi:hypothetical protein